MAPATNRGLERTRRERLQFVRVSHVKFLECRGGLPVRPLIFSTGSVANIVDAEALFYLAMATELF